MQLKSLIANLFSSIMKYVQTDKGKEFANRQFVNLFSLSGIHHRFSCSYTPKQMVIDERKHHHIVETCLVLLAII